MASYPLASVTFKNLTLIPETVKYGISKLSLSGFFFHCSLLSETTVGSYILDFIFISYSPTKVGTYQMIQLSSG